VTYHWKGFEESYNFVSGNILIRIHMQKLQKNKILNSFVPWGNLSSFSPRDMIVPSGKKGLSCSSGQLKFLFLGDMIVPQGKKCLSCSSGQLKLLYP
jgi:hypothetical protein